MNNNIPTKLLLLELFYLGGAQRQASYLINNQNFDEIILLKNNISFDIKTKSKITPLNKEIKIYKRFFENIKAIKYIQQTTNSKDTILSFLERPNILNIKAAKKTKHKTIISVRNYLSILYKSPLFTYRKHLIKNYYPLADLIITNSKESKNDLINNFKVPEEKIKVIYNIIDNENINKLKQEPIEEKYKKIFENPVIINVGSLTPKKNQMQLIESFKEINNIYPNYNLVIIGEGSLRKKLENKIQDLNLTNNVFLLGKQKNPFKYIYNSDFFVLNSNVEGFPNVLLESLSVGTPVISKNCFSGPKEMLEIENYDNKDIQLTKYGYIFPQLKNNKTKEKEYLSESTKKMIELKKDKDKMKEIKENCKKRAKDFEKEKILQQWEE